MDMEKLEQNLETKMRESSQKAKESDREAKRLAPIEELSMRNRRCHRRAAKTKGQTTRSYGDDTFIILGRLDEDDEDKGYVAAKIRGGRRQVDGGNKESYCINFYSLNDAETSMVQEDPFDKDNGVDSIGVCIAQEKSYEIRWGTSRVSAGGESFEHSVSNSRSGKRFNPFGAMNRYIKSRRISANLDQFEQSLGQIEEAITDPELNPALIELAGQKTQAQQQTA